MIQGFGTTNTEQPSSCSHVKFMNLAYIAHFLAQNCSHIQQIFLVGILLFTPYSRSILRTAKIWYKISSIFVSCS